MLTSLAGPGGYAQGNPWTVLANVWNPSGLVYGRDYTQTITFDPAAPNIGWSVSWSFDAKNATGPGSYSQPNLEYGTSPSSSGTNTYNSGLPLLVSAISSVQVEWGTHWTGSTGFNVNIDLRLAHGLGGGGASVADDIIIWTHAWGRPLGTAVGTYQVGGVTYDLWYISDNAYFGSSHTQGFTFVPRQDLPSGAIDLIDIFSVIKARNALVGDEYLYDVQIGPEITQGTGTFTADYFTVNVNGIGNYFGPSQVSYLNGVADDTIRLYGPAKGANPGVTAAMIDTLYTTVVVELNGTRMNGQTPIVDVTINGVDYGRTTLTDKASGYVDGAGVSHTAYQDLVLHVPGLTSIQSLKVAMVSPVSIGGPEDASVFLNFVKVNDISLVDATYTAPQGYTKSHIIGSTSNLPGGVETIDATPWNQALAARAVGTAAKPMTVDGGAGSDTLYVLGASSAYSVTQTAAGKYEVRESAGLGENADLANVETLIFQDGLYLRLPRSNEGVGTFSAPVQLVVEKVLRTNDASFVDPLSAKVLRSEITMSQALVQVIRESTSTTSVATLAYEFFTGKVPSAAGMDYLVSPTGPNPNNLNSAYYAQFSTTNRYINFASNLGKVGEGAAAFQASYGALTLEQATAKAYATIFGSAPSADKVSHLLHDAVPNGLGGTYEREDYFAGYGFDGLNGQGTKAAMVGWLLSQAAQADLGTYAKSNDAFLLDVAQNGAPFGVDLVGKYAKPEFTFLG